MNEELLSYVLLYRSGFETETLFENALNRIFLATPEDKDLLELECMGFSDAVRYLSVHFDYQNLNADTLCRYLIQTLKTFRPAYDLETFAEKTASLWDILPIPTHRKESPLYLIYFYPDMIRAGKTEVLRDCIEEMLSYYDDNPEVKSYEENSQ